VKELEAMNPLPEFAEKIVKVVDKLIPFGKFERFTAGVCMAIPFFLLVADVGSGQAGIWMIAAACGVALFPFVIGAVEKITGENAHKYFGMIIILSGSAMLYIFYRLFTKVFELESRNSISAYVMMDDSYYFGMLLAIAAMLFIASGVVYWEKRREFKEGPWRSVINIILGVLLIGVIIIPCNTYPTLHLIIALLFFAGCGIATLFRKSKPEPGTRLLHRVIDFAAVGVMLAAMAIAVAREYALISDKLFPSLNLFGAESIALWITGLDFILVSLKREVNPAVNGSENKKGVARENTSR
jgi:hypothetical protein